MVREHAKLRAAHAAKPQIGLKDLAGSVGKGKWDKSAAATGAKMLKQPVHAELPKAVAAGKAIDTQTAHRTGPNGTYSAERQALHDRIISNLLQGKQAHKNPEAIFTAGGPASGKSSLEKHGKMVLPNDVVHANPDVIREMLPEYQQLKAAGREDAAGLTHEEASHLAKVVTRIAMGRQHHLFVDTVGDSGPGKFAGKIQKAQRAGYKTSVHYATIPVSEAIKRADARGVKTGRYVDHGYLREAHAAVSQRVGDVLKISGVHVHVFDTSGVPRLLATKSAADDKLSIKNAAGYKAFLDKARG